jgi:hypothetical protein
MSDNQTVWTILLKHALTGTDPLAPFEVSEVVPQVAAALNIPEKRATQLVGGMLAELSRLPDGKQFFCREGNAVGPLPEIAHISGSREVELAAYPYEL